MTCSGHQALGLWVSRANKQLSRVALNLMPAGPETGLGGWSAPAALGTGSRNDSGGNVRLWLQACPREHTVSTCYQDAFLQRSQNAFHLVSVLQVLLSVFYG